MNKLQFKVVRVLKGTNVYNQPKNITPFLFINIWMYIEGNNNENKNGCGGGLQYDVPCCLGVGACVLKQ